MMIDPVQFIANNKIVENLVKDYFVESLYKDDLIQEIYLILLTYNKQKLLKAIENKQIRFLVARIICNQYFSCTSSFFRKYKRYNLNKETLRKIIDEEDTDPEEEDC